MVARCALFEATRVPTSACKPLLQPAGAQPSEELPMKMESAQRILHNALLQSPLSGNRARIAAPRKAAQPELKRPQQAYKDPRVSRRCKSRAMKCNVTGLVPDDKRAHLSSRRLVYVPGAGPGNTRRSLFPLAAAPAARNELRKFADRRRTP